MDHQIKVKGKEFLDCKEDGNMERIMCTLCWSGETSIESVSE
jgi:hypothetical protein